MKTSRSLRFTISRSILGGILVSAAVAPWLLADVEVKNTTVISGQNYNVANPGDISTNGTVEVQSGGTAVFLGRTVVLKPGFHAAAGAAFVATLDADGDGFSDTADTDLDGLPDWWEYAHFGNLTTVNGAGDYDSDGMTNLAEYLAGRNPKINEATTAPLGSGVVAVKVPSGLYYSVDTGNWTITPITPP